MKGQKKTSKRFDKDETYPVKIKSFTLALGITWSLIVIISFLWNGNQTKNSILEIARSKARVAYEKDVIYRRWNAAYGGVYVPVSEKSPPNPYLKVSDRDVITNSGAKLTKMNPAYMTRQVHELAKDEHGIQGHITSLDPIRPENAPDSWEFKALRAFEQGEGEVSSVENIGGIDYLRLMRPLITERGCLKCHAEQGYKQGDIRGGISVSLPMKPLLAIEQSQHVTLALGHGFLWLFGVIGLALGSNRLSQQIENRAHAEKALHESEEKFRKIIESSPMGVHLYRMEPDRQLIFIGANPSADTILEIEHKQLIGKTIEEAFPPFVNTEIPEQYRSICTDGIPWHKEQVNYEGSQTKGAYEVHAFQTAPGMMATFFLDITKRERAEEALRESEEKYRHLFETAMVGIYQTRIEDGKFLVANQALAKMLGYDSVDRLVEEYITSTHYSDPEIRKELLNQLQSHGRVDGFEIEMMRMDGSTAHIVLSAIAYLDQGYMEGVIVDITERKRAEAALRESEQKFRALVEQSPLGISLIGNDGRYKYVNPRFQEMFGYTIHDCSTGKEWFKIAYPDEAYRQKVLEAWIEELQQTEAGKVRPHVYVVTCKDGSRKEIHFRPVTMENQDQFIVYEDVTERSKMEHQLQQTQRFEAIGTLAGGIAHDFNNLLMGIQGRASLMSADLEHTHPHFEHTNAIEDYIRSATDLTRQLLGLARGGKYEVKPIDTNELVRNSSDMFGRTKKEIRIHTNFYDPPPVIAVDRNQIEQVLLNLYINAWQAMPGGGDLYLETQIATLDRAYCEPYQATPGHYAKISVTDTGVGMDSVTKQRIFDPFFTTKTKGRGTGLGLASAYGIIKNHAGIIIVDSEIGRGTKFNIYLPLSEKEASKKVPIEERLIRGSETVLLIDDEEMILEVEQAMLEKLGYHVFATTSGEKALELVKRKGKDIDMVILDLIMPGMDGSRVFDGIRKILPQMPVMLSSGYAINGQADDIMQRGCNGFIQKPFNISELSKKIRQIIDEAKFKD
ncbi:MAG: PAS domain S-box protein [Desulfobacterales bacterium]|nr:PAS domain S-box protein [Desulfobacterales bacterium]MDX2510555.1 PAS domain S-box protein [Desulfobacterales bacterium]